ncbi:aldehyde dehydrogenase (NADP(+)) [Erwinia sp. OLTSP20]|uniref:aldehyde dehydrogenase (NADP(+)) n=1 Tax=unclassified Erwinia TaxID=2622719 RepID=UPI000C1A2B0C|nr:MULTISPECIES: aldehyde dehydrogenase (NADP(+)) [unclassified Erwinia]PIJ50884.1 aldehyde dehydrogenase (NADP(+)) [Erwinia sp. OAMSP11]PIJ73270.1 aldehyde dehydrogenase (NADP(+)) [Erwinia sp. OLSSP12]PIJ82284.1 aldehyde dehydrogenase (NADP(+)) [Erwinia sp. OLCASP19]PIJ85436.1 aldehyde dehydrogenase (NADP(+)) [Erwinia sp. OLMTSP26]PIJ87133.1 aldehyde dehydrogenase (NADP(+)) [Erwinia sp. OLMDSP33]
MKISGYNFINGERSGENPSTLNSFDAHTGAALKWTFHPASRKEAEAACQAAAQAFAAYQATSPAQRATFLETIADEIDALDDDFIQLVMRETALAEGRIRGERARTSGQMRLFATVLRRGDFLGARIDQALPDRQPLPRPDLRQVKRGVGPVAVFGASNFPLAFSTAGGDTAAALAAGCPVVMKAHSGHMATAECVAQAICNAVQRCGMPAGVFNMIYGSGIGEVLVRHPAIQAVGFTGSLKGGRALCDMAAARPCPIPVFAEMSSINPMIILPAALKSRGEKIAADLVASVALGCGQFCTNPGLFIGIRSPEFSQLLQQMASHLAQSPAQTMLNRDVLRSYEKGLNHLHLHAGLTHLAGKLQQGSQAYPQLFKASARMLVSGDPLLQEEVFGPVTIAVEVEDQYELEQALSGLRGQLTASLLADGEDLQQFANLVPLLEQKVGRLLLNSYPTGVEVSDAMVHGGPYPATSDVRGTSVGTLAIDRFLRPICYQDYPQSLLPDSLKDANPWQLRRLVNGQWSEGTL